MAGSDNFHWQGMCSSLSTFLDVTVPSDYSGFSIRGSTGHAGRFHVLDHTHRDFDYRHRQRQALNNQRHRGGLEKNRILAPGVNFRVQDHVPQTRIWSSLPRWHAIFEHPWSIILDQAFGFGIGECNFLSNDVRSALSNLLPCDKHCIPGINVVLQSALACVFPDCLHIDFPIDASFQPVVALCINIGAFDEPDQRGGFAAGGSMSLGSAPPTNADSTMAHGDLLW
jgi:hypothetical protein